MTPSIAEIAVADLASPLPESLVVLDVREDDEWHAGHIDAALHIPLRDVPQRLAEISSDHRVLVVCRVGARSGQATAFLQAQGKDVVNLAGGMLEWARNGRSMVTEGSGPPSVR
ncbi:MAG: rhodanese-like domain-containing protein [Nocardioidaceae bacterium]